jgi:hypothetical protein
MSREMAIIALGIWVLILPHLGVPRSWLVVITTLTGIAIIAIGLYLRAAMISRGARRSSHHPFIENSAMQDGHSNDHNQQVHG